MFRRRRKYNILLRTTGNILTIVSGTNLIRTYSSRSRICSRTNSKNILNFVWCKLVRNKSDLIQEINLNQSELGLIQTRFSIRINREHFKLRFIQNENSVSINSNLDWFGFIRTENLAWNYSHTLNPKQWKTTV